MMAGTGPAAKDESAPVQRTIYSIGWNLGRDLDNYHFTAEERDLVAAGFRDAVDGTEPRMKLGTSEPHALRLEAQRMAIAAAPERAASEAFVAAEAKRLDVTPSRTGLVYQSLQDGKGAGPALRDSVTVAYEIRKRDGVIVQSSGKRPIPFLLASPGTLPCLREALLQMRVGGKSHFICPPHLAYGDRNHGSLIPAGSALVVDAELIAVGAPVPGAGH